MSKTLINLDNIAVSQFCGKNHELMIQLSGNQGYIQINKKEVYQTIVCLTEWLKEQAVKDRKRIKQLIEENITLERTIYKDAIDCEKFIADLKVIDIPLKLLELK